MGCEAGKHLVDRVKIDVSMEERQFLLSSVRHQTVELFLSRLLHVLINVVKLNTLTVSVRRKVAPSDMLS